MPEDAWHKFIGDSRDEGRHEMRDHVLCLKYRDENVKYSVMVTTINADVTCQECLELIHA